MSKWGPYSRTRHLLQTFMLANWVCLWSVHSLSEKRAKSPSSIFPKSQHWARHARTCTEKHTLQYSAEGSGTSRRQHPVPTEWLLCHKGQFGFSLAQLPAWDLSASLADLWPQVFLFCFGNVAPFFSLFSSPAPSLLFLFVSSGLQRVSWEPGWLPSWQPPNRHPPSPRDGLLN